MPRMSSKLLESRRLQLEEAALSLFTSRGFHGVGLRDIAKEARVSIGNLYNHFENKEALFKGLIERLYADFASASQPLAIYIASANFPDDMQGDYLICNTIGYLGIKQYSLDRDGGHTRTEKRSKETVTIEHKVGEVWGTPKADLLVSEDKNFRPSDAVFGADGGLYVADWHNVIIGHMQHNVRDPNRDHRHGRVYRITAKGRPLQEDVAIAGESIPALLKVLEHPIDGVRQRARLELSGRDSKEVIAACATWMKAFDPKKKEDAHHLLEALWLQISV